MRIDFRAPASNPTTVQITIHQPKNSISTSTSSDRLSHNSNHSPLLPLPIQPVAASGSAVDLGSPVPQQVLQKLVISQTSSGSVIQQSKLTGLAPQISHLSQRQCTTLLTSLLSVCRCGAWRPRPAHVSSEEEHASDNQQLYRSARLRTRRPSTDPRYDDP